MFSLLSLLSFSRQQHLQHSQEASLWKVGISISWTSSLKIQHPFFRLWRRGLGFYQRQSWRPCVKLWRKAHNVLCRLSGAGLDIWNYTQITISNPLFRLMPSQISFLGWQNITCANSHNVRSQTLFLGRQNSACSNPFTRGDYEWMSGTESVDTRAKMKVFFLNVGKVLTDMSVTWVDWNTINHFWSWCDYNIEFTELEDPSTYEIVYMLPS